MLNCKPAARRKNNEIRDLKEAIVRLTSHSIGRVGKSGISARSVVEFHCDLCRHLISDSLGLIERTGLRVQTRNLIIMDKANLMLLRRSRMLDRVKNLLNKGREENAPHRACGWIVNFLVFRSEQYDLVELKLPWEQQDHCQWTSERAL